MDTKQFLSFTHGTILKNLCTGILNAPEQEKSAYRRWVLSEQKRMRKNQPVMWSIPISAECYYCYLSKIEKALQDAAYVKSVASLLEEIRQITRKKIHALFLTQELFCWPSLESVFNAARDSDDYEATVVYTPFSHKNYAEQTDYFDGYIQQGVPILHHNAYNLEEDSPDVVFVLKPYSNIPEPYIIKNLETVIPRIVYIPYGMEITTDLIRYGFQFYGHYKAWKHCAYGPIVKDYGTKYGYRNGENIAIWGHPKADHYLSGEKKQIPEELRRRIGSRKVILWTPHHLIDLNENGTGTWLIWGKHILKAALNNPELFFIIRPHPLMFGALVNTNSLTQKQVDDLRRKIDEAENIVWDTNDDYRIAIDAADAIITDGTTFCIEFLYTKKPILLTPRNIEGFYMYKEMMESYYVVNSTTDISVFMDMMKSGEDPLREKRYALYKKMFFLPEKGTVGENIVTNVKAEIESECAMPEFEKKAVDPEVNKKDVNADTFPLVSILILCYKNQDLLYGMLDTVFRQDYPRIQLIISDDCSENFPEDKIKNYIDMNNRGNIEKVLVRTNEVNMRTVRHIDYAMRFVEGEYLIFTAADDRFCGTDVVSAYVESFLQNPEKLWIVAKCRVTSPDYSRTYHYLPTSADEPFFRADNAERLFSRWSRRGMAIPCCMAFRTVAIATVGGFDLDYLFMEDWPLVLKLLRSGYAPIFCDKITALHSAGGITNSNQRYGKELRRLFYEDKYTIFRKEVIPFMHILTKEDQKAYKQYMREIMARHYFFYVDMPDTTIWQKLKLGFQKPIRFWWMFEQLFNKLNIPKKKLFVLGVCSLIVSVPFHAFGAKTVLSELYSVFGWSFLGLGVLMMFVALVSYPLQMIFNRKAKLRHNLVN